MAIILPQYIPERVGLYVKPGLYKILLEPGILGKGFGTILSASV